MSDEGPEGDDPRRDDGESDREDSFDGEDPFDRLGPDAERDGDPFDRLDADAPESGRPDASEAGTPNAPESGQQDGDDDSPVDPWSPDADARDAEAVESGATPEAGAVDESFDADDPFAHVETPSESPFDGGGSPFERVDAGSVDPDQVWTEITADEGDDADGDADGEGDPPRPGGSRYSEVSKHRFCEGCEHFSAPPDVSCAHETAEIIEFLDMDTVRLLDCPVVAEREALERGE